VTVDITRISRLGFGVSGPHKTWAVSREATGRLILQAVDLGINVFDTAPKYGDGEAERRLGTAVSQLDRSRLFLVSKAGILGENNRRDFSADGIVRSVEGSLRRLKTDHLDALLLQGAATSELTDELFDALDQLKTAGKIRYAGASGRGEELDAPIGDPRFDLIMAAHYYGQSETQKQRLRAARGAGKIILGIEAKNGSPSGFPSPFSRAGLWYASRAALRMVSDLSLRIRGERLPPRGDKPIAEAFEWAINDPLSDCLMVQTTRPAHLQSLAHMAGLDAGPGAA
jgi:aryl-alcohol dehydrogenase-like predicted oxidoreductase